MAEHSCFRLGTRWHIHAGSDPYRMVGACGLIAIGEPDLEAVADTHPAMCRSCLLVNARNSWVEEPLEVAEGRGYEFDAHFG